MADADKTLEIQIKTVAEMSGAEKALAKIRESIREAKALGKATEELAAQERVAAAAVDDYKDKLGPAAKETEHLEMNHHALHRILNLIGQNTAPELGHALSGAMYGPIGGVLALGYALEWLSEKFKVAHEDAVKLAEIKWDTQIQAANDLAEAYANLAAALKKAGEDADPIKTKFDRQLAVLNQILEAHKNILAAMEKEEEAAAGNDEAKKADVRRKYDTAKAAYDSAAERKKVEAKEKEETEHEQKQPNMEAEARRRAEILAEYERDPDIVKDKATLARYDKGDKKGQYEDAMAEVNRLGGENEAKARIAALDAKFAANAGTAIGQAAMTSAQLLREKLAIIAEQHGAQTRVDAYDAGVKLRHEASDKATQDAKANKEAITRLKSEIETLKQTFSVKTAGAEIQKAIEFAGKTKGGTNMGAVNAGESEFMMTIATLLAGKNVTAKESAVMFDHAGKSGDVLDQFIATLGAKLLAMKDFPGFQKQLGQYEQVANPATLQEAAAAADAARHGHAIAQGQADVLNTLSRLLGSLHLNQKQTLDLIADANNNAEGMSQLQKEMARTIYEQGQAILRNRNALNNR